MKIEVKLAAEATAIITKTASKLKISQSAVMAVVIEDYINFAKDQGK